MSAERIDPESALADGHAIARGWARKRRSEFIDGAEAESVASLAVAKALDTWDPDLGPFGPWMASRVLCDLRDHARTIYGRRNQKQPPRSLDQEMTWHDGAGNDNDPGRHDKGLLAASKEDGYPYLAADYVASVEEHDRPQMFYVLHGLLQSRSQEAIARSLGVTGSRISQVVAAIRDDYLCWAGDRACGRNTSCPRCRAVKRAITLARQEAAKERKRAEKAAQPPKPRKKPAPRTKPDRPNRPSTVRLASYLAKEERAGRSIQIAREAKLALLAETEEYYRRYPLTRWQGS